MDPVVEELVKLTVSWSGRQLEIALGATLTVAHLKMHLQQLTNVIVSRQKIMGLTVAGKPATDSATMKELNLKPNQKVMMMGTPEQNIIAEPSQVVDDFDLTEGELVLDPKDAVENHKKIENRLKTYTPKILNDPRPGMKLLVLDIDYTLFDHRSTVERPLELMRPYLHEFLEIAYKNYDIMIWSATSLKWIELKMGELGVLSHTQYKITALYDDRAMITVQSSKYGVYNAKPLQVIWGKFSDLYSPKNTIMFDDLRRNFIMNPRSGLRIKPFKNAPTEGKNDDELVHLSKYLQLIATAEDLSELDHSKWRKLLKAHKHHRTE